MKTAGRDAQQGPGARITLWAPGVQKGSVNVDFYRRHSTEASNWDDKIAHLDN